MECFRVMESKVKGCTIFLGHKIYFLKMKKMRLVTDIHFFAVYLELKGIR